MKLGKFSVLVATMLLLSACVSYSSNKENIDLSVPSENALLAIEPGMTSANWLLDNLGEPDVVRRPDSHTQIWQYENVRVHSTRLRAFPLIAIKSETHKRTTFNFEVANNQIVRYWKDSPEEV